MHSHKENTVNEFSENLGHAPVLAFKLWLCGGGLLDQLCLNHVYCTVLHGGSSCGHQLIVTVS